MRGHPGEPFGAPVFRPYLITPPDAPPGAPAPPKPPPAEPQEPPQDITVEDGPPVVLLVGLAVSLAGTLVSHYGVRTIIRTLWSRPKHFFGRLFARFGPNPTDMSHSIEQALSSVFSHWFVHTEPHVARWLRKEAHIVEQATGTIMAQAEWTYDALRILRWQTVPQLILRATRPIVAAVNKLDPSLPNAQSTWNTASRYINNALASANWGTAPSFETTLRQLAAMSAWARNQTVHFQQDVWQPFLLTQFQPTKVRVDYIWNDLYRRGRDGIDGIRARLGELEAKLAPILTSPTTWILAGLGTVAGMAGLQTLLRRGNPNLYCDNTTNFTEDLCASPAGTGHQWAGMLNGLLGLILAAEILVHPDEVLAAAQEVESILEPGLEWMAGVSGESFATVEGDIVARVGGLLGL